MLDNDPLLRKWEYLVLLPVELALVALVALAHLHDGRHDDGRWMCTGGGGVSGGLGAGDFMGEMIAFVLLWAVRHRQWISASSVVLGVVCVPSVVRLVYMLLFGVREETLQVVHEHGVQIERTWYSGARTRVFVDLESIESIIVNEGFRMHQVVYYMVIIVRGKEKLLLPFEVCVCVSLSESVCPR